MQATGMTAHRLFQRRPHITPPGGGPVLLCQSAKGLGVRACSLGSWQVGRGGTVWNQATKRSVFRPVHK